MPYPRGRVALPAWLGSRSEPLRLQFLFPVDTCGCSEDLAQPLSYVVTVCSKGERAEKRGVRGQLMTLALCTLGGRARPYLGPSAVMVEIWTGSDPPELQDAGERVYEQQFRVLVGI